jgi:hypothetical protein
MIKENPAADVNGPSISRNYSIKKEKKINGS